MVKEYNFIIPFGSDCLTAMTLNTLGLRKKSFPFDWLYIDSKKSYFQEAMDCILDDFHHFFKLPNFKIDGKALGTHQTWKIKDKGTDFIFMHDVKLTENVWLKYRNVSKKYQRRIKRLKNILSENNDVLLLYMEQNKTPDKMFIQKMAKLAKKYPNANIDLLVLQHDGNKGELEQETIQLTGNIKKIVYNNDYKYSPRSDDIWFRNEKMYTKIIQENCVTKPTVSVVMPTYNAEKYLKEAIDSILAQTFTDFELLIVDDNSKDKTIDIIKSYQDPRIKLIEGPNKGIAAALNKGIREARGKYIARMDADDISLPDRFKKQVEFLEKHEDISLVGSWQHHFGLYDSYHRPPSEPEVLKTVILLGCEMCHSTVMFRKDDFVSRHLFYPENSPQEDFELWSKAIGELKLANIPEVLGEYRVTGNSITDDKDKILTKYETKLICKNLQNYLSIKLLKKDEKLLCRRHDIFFILDKKGKRELQKKLVEIYKSIEQNGEKFGFAPKKYLHQGLCYVWKVRFNKENYVKNPYISLKRKIKNFVETIFSIKNSFDKSHKIIKFCGIQLKLKR